jgi:hypothetical protein
VSNFVAYSINGLKSHVFLVINPKPSVVKTNQKPQYFIVIDTVTLKAYECEYDLETMKDRLTKVFFFSSTGFLG